MIDAKEQPVLGKINQQRNQIIPSSLNFNVLPLAQIVNADVRDRSARHRAGHFFTDEKIRVPPQRIAAINRVVIRQRE